MRGVDLSFRVARLLEQSASSLEIASSTPTTDVTEIVFTGLSDHEVVLFSFNLTHISDTGSTYTVQARTSGGTWRDIATQSAAADATSALFFSGIIFGFNQAQAKAGVALGKNNSSVLDDSDANVFVTGGNNGWFYNSFKEVWDELKIVSSTASSISGATADQRGRSWAVGL